MARVSSKPQSNTNDLFDQLISEGISSFEGGGDINVVEFAEDFIFNGEHGLYPTQRTLLKAFYNEPLDENELLLLEEWCLDNRTTWIPGRDYRNLVIEIGRRGSKSTIVSLIVLYEFYKLISLKNPAAYYGLLPNSPIAIFIIAQSQEQVKETIFAQVRGYALNSQYFKGLEKSGKIEILQEEIRCQGKNILVGAKHTNSKSLVGYSLKVLVIDEAARFEYDEFGNSKADLIWRNIGKGVSTFGKDGHKIAISSAWEPGDYIEKLLDVAKRDPSTLGFRLRTWDMNMNPNLSEAVIKAGEDYINDPISAATEYEGIRANKQGTFMNKENVRKAFTGLCAWDAKQIPWDVVNQEGEERNYVATQIDRLTHLSAGQSFAHCDYGVKKDSAAFSICHPIQLEGGKWAIQVDGFLVWKPFIDRNANNEAVKRIVSFLDVEEKLIRLCKARKVIKMSFDSFNSEHALQKLHLIGISTVEMSTTNQNQLMYYTVTKNLIDQGLLILPMDSAWTPTAELELSNVIQIPTTGRVDHVKGGSKDIADAIANSVYNCYCHMAKSGLMAATGVGVQTISSKTRGKVEKLQGKGKLRIGAAMQKLKERPN